MIIEIKGIGFPNRGAALMARAITTELKARLGDVIFVVMPDTPYEQRAALGLYQKVDKGFKGWFFYSLIRLISKRIRRRLGVVLESEVDVVIDASGFAYGDQWGHQKAMSRLGGIGQLKSQGKKVILLPQAFGPFSSEEIVRVMKTIVQHADAVYARDDESMKYLQEATGSSSIELAPDFTNLIQGETRSVDKELNGRICFIPNHKINEKGSAGKNEYVIWMASVIEFFQSQGELCFLLNHEGAKDYSLIQKINELLAESVPVVNVESPTLIKGVIGQSKLVFSSRFHGLVSALSQGVPVIAHGWSHKYARLLNDYGCKEYNIAALGDLAEIEALYREVSDSDQGALLREKISECALVEKQKTQRMWEAVESTLS